MSGEEEESTDIFRNKLYENFHNEGLLDNLKVQLRYKLLEKLQGKDGGKENINLLNSEKEDSLLIRRVMASLFADYLKTFQYNYSLSVFLPECGFSSKILEKAEMTEILNIKYKIPNLLGSKNALLQDLAEHLIKRRSRDADRTNSCTQTEYSDRIHNLEDKLSQIDSNFKEKYNTEKLMPAKTVEERLLKFKKEFETRTRAEMNAEVTRIREFEVSAVRIEEAEKWRQKMELYREELEKAHQDRLNKLKERERETLDKFKDRMRDIEGSNYEHRQKVLKDFELLRLREEQIGKQYKLDEETIAVEKQKIINMERELKNKIREVDEMKLQIQTRYDHDIAYNKLSLIKEIEDEKLSIQEKKRQLEEDLAKVYQLKETISQLTKQNKQLTADNEKMSENIKDLKKKKKEQEYELSQLRDSMRTISDSSRRDQEQLKGTDMRVQVLQEEIRLLKETLNEKNEVFTEQKQVQNDLLRKHQREIQTYQETIEEKENIIRQLQDRLNEKKKAIQAMEESIDSIDMKDLNSKQRIKDAAMELENMKKQRDEELNRILNDQKPIQLDHSRSRINLPLDLQYELSMHRNNPYSTSGFIQNNNYLFDNGQGGNLIEETFREFEDERSYFGDKATNLLPINDRSKSNILPANQLTTQSSVSKAIVGQRSPPNFSSPEPTTNQYLSPNYSKASESKKPNDYQKPGSVKVEAPSTKPVAKKDDYSGKRNDDDEDDAYFSNKKTDDRFLTVPELKQTTSLPPSKTSLNDQKPGSLKMEAPSTKQVAKKDDYFGKKNDDDEEDLYFSNKKTTGAEDRFLTVPELKQTASLPPSKSSGITSNEKKDDRFSGGAKSSERFDTAFGKEEASKTKPGETFGKQKEPQANVKLGGDFPEKASDFAASKNLPQKGFAQGETPQKSLVPIDKPSLSKPSLDSFASGQNALNKAADNVKSFAPEKKETFSFAKSNTNAASTGLKLPDEPKKASPLPSTQGAASFKDTKADKGSDDEFDFDFGLGSDNKKENKTKEFNFSKPKISNTTSSSTKAGLVTNTYEEKKGENLGAKSIGLGLPELLPKATKTTSVKHTDDDFLDDFVSKDSERKQEFGGKKLGKMDLPDLKSHKSSPAQVLSKNDYDSSSTNKKSSDHYSDFKNKFETSNEKHPTSKEKQPSPQKKRDEPEKGDENYEVDEEIEIEEIDEDELFQY